MNKKIINVAIWFFILIAIAVIAIIPYSYWKSEMTEKKTNLKKTVIFKNYSPVQSTEFVGKFSTFDSQLPWYDVAQANYAFPDPPCLNQFWKPGDCGRFDDWIEKTDFTGNLTIIKEHNNKFKELQKQVDVLNLDKTQTDCTKISQFDQFVSLSEIQSKEIYDTTKEELNLNKKSCQNPRVIRILTDEVKEILLGKRKELSQDDIQKQIQFCSDQVDSKIKNFEENCQWVERKNCTPGHYPMNKCIDRKGPGRFVSINDDLKNFIENPENAKKINWWIEPKTEPGQSPKPYSINPD